MIWTVASIVLLLRVPIGVGVAYVIAIAGLYRWWRRRDAARREVDLAAARDTMRADQPPARRGDRPSGRGYGGHSWSRHPDSGPDESGRPGT